MKDWQRFVLAHGWKVWVHELAAVLGRPTEEILRLRSSKACTRRSTVKRFAELFALWHGRPPRDEEWPRPRKSHRGSYDWQAPELALLASLVGRLGKAEISMILTKRLQKLSGDRRATRSLNAVQMGINHRLGMVTTDVVGGITIAEAGREIGSRATIYHCIRQKELRPFRVGRLWVIPRDAWEAWKKTRILPPKGYVQLSALRVPLGFKSDAKLPEFASLGYIPTAVCCNPYGIRLHTRGAWFIDQKVARKLVADRRAGRPMPWWGQPNPGNLKKTWSLLEERRHPPECRSCAQIWGRKGAPTAYADYLERYPPLALGAKRHMTKVWTPGLTMAEVMRHCGCSILRVRRAIDNGVLTARRHRKRVYVSRADATHWHARRCPAGAGVRSWISFAGACSQYLFTPRQLRRFIAEEKVRSKIGTDGTMRGVQYVSKHQCGQLRQSIGFTEKEAARRVGVSIERMRVLLKGCQWRDARGIPLATVRAMQQRYESAEGYTIQEAAARLRVTPDWIHRRKLDGTIRILRTRWDRRRQYISEPQFRRLVEFKRHPVKRERFGRNWLFLSQAAEEAGVSNATVVRWAAAGDVHRRNSIMGWRYHRRSVRARARRYWASEVRFLRATPPAWLGQRAANDDQIERKAA